MTQTTPPKDWREAPIPLSILCVIYTCMFLIAYIIYTAAMTDRLVALERVRLEAAAAERAAQQPSVDK